MELNETQKKIKENYEAMTELQLDKNMKYGNSGLEPLGVFLQAERVEKTSTIGILCRLDDKLMRVKNSKQLRVNDICDLIGYLNLLLIDLDISKDDILNLKD